MYSVGSFPKICDEEKSPMMEFTRASLIGKDTGMVNHFVSCLVVYQGSHAFDHPACPDDSTLSCIPTMRSTQLLRVLKISVFVFKNLPTHGLPTHDLCICGPQNIWLSHIWRYNAEWHTRRGWIASIEYQAIVSRYLGWSQAHIRKAFRAASSEHLRQTNFVN